jgi:hypothetical protein
MEGYFRDNKDGTFTKGERGAIDKSERLYVSRVAAAMASRGEGPLYLIVGEALGHLIVWSGTWHGYSARVASMPLTSADVAKGAVRA